MKEKHGYGSSDKTPMKEEHGYGSSDKTPMKEEHGYGSSDKTHVGGGNCRYRYMYVVIMVDRTMYTKDILQDQRLQRLVPMHSGGWLLLYMDVDIFFVMFDHN